MADIFISYSKLDPDHTIALALILKRQRDLVGFQFASW